MSYTLNGNTWNVITLPSSPVAPDGLEILNNTLVSDNTNEFTHEKTFYNWSVSYLDLSVSYASMLNATAQTWISFFRSLSNPSNVFCFSQAVCNSYPLELTLDGLQNSSNPRYFRSKKNQVQWAVTPGGIYRAVTFEITEVL